MGLKIQKRVTFRARMTTTLIAVFALLVQPAYGLISGQVANAVGPNPSTVVVNALTGKGWDMPDTRSNGHVKLVSDSTAPMGSGALSLKTDINPVSGQDKAQFVNRSMWPAPLDLSTVASTDLSYSTKQNSASFVAGLPSYQMEVNLNGASGYTTLVYEPYNNDGNAAVHANEWQSWNVGNGKLWSSRTIASSTDNFIFQSSQGQYQYNLSDILTHFPNAKVLSVGVNVGSNNPGYDTEVDSLSFNNQTYDFEPLAQVATANIVTGDTATSQNVPGWMFNRDTDTKTPFEFNTNEHKIGAGSLYVAPIGSNPADKFIAEDFAKTAVVDFNSYSYDFKIAGNGTASSADDFYTSVYVNKDNSDKYYDCRYDFAPQIGSTSDFTRFSFNVDSQPVQVVKSSSGRLGTCPATLAAMPAGSYIRAYAINVGQSNANDTGLAGYLDNVVLNTTSAITTSDFEQIGTPTDLMPANGAATNNASFDNTWAAVNGAVKYEYETTYNGGGYYHDTSDSGNYVIGGSTITRHNNNAPEATYTWHVRGINANGQPGPWSNYNTVTVDTHAPAAVALKAPANNAVQKTNDFYFTWYAPSDTGTALHYEFQSSQNSSATNGVLNSGVWKSVDSTDPEQNNLTQPKIHSTGAQGTWFWQARAVDAAGNQGPWSPIWKMTIDQVPPAGEITSIGGVSYTGIPLNVKSTKGKLVIVGTANDNISMNRIGVQLVKPGVSGDIQYLYANNNGLYGKEGLVNWQAEFDTTALALADGAYGLNISYVDKVGNVVTEKAFFTLDNTRPVVAFAAPLNFSKPFQSLPAITISASDATSGLSGTPVIHVYNSDGTPTVAWCSALSCDTSMLTGGDYSVKAGVKDKSGNNQTITANFTIDNIAPIVSINKPAATTASLPLTLTGKVDGTQAGLSIFNGTAKIGDVNPADIASNGDWSYVLPAGLSQGSHTLSVVATDVAGNSSSVSTSPLSMTTFTVEPFQSSLQDNGSIKAPDSVRPITPPVLIARTNSANNFNTAGPAITQPDPAAVLGTKTAKDNNAVLSASQDIAAIAPSEQGWKIFGMAWYWWVLIVAAIASIIWWIVAAARRRNQTV